MSTGQGEGGWQFVTNHTQVLLCIARDPDIRLRDMADAVGVTLGSAQRILADLVEAGYVQREREGRRNRYVINRDAPMLRHAAQEGHDIGGLLDLLRLDESD
ncbi:MAG TPA: winged helix-turn-helix domain-containing protein [Solirubrobacteraceae bacterium]|nr:winged helix-turn-helix domain-containing protein [Solirubrobacteraceae bacterium]